jgi:hypothetical protein
MQGTDLKSNTPIRELILVSEVKDLTGSAGATALELFVAGGAAFECFVAEQDRCLSPNFGHLVAILQSLRTCS